MKKLGAICILLTALSSPGFSSPALITDWVTQYDVIPGIPFDPKADPPAGAGRETVVAAGFECGIFGERFFDGARNVKTRRASPGFNCFTYSIRDGKKVGYFLHDIFTSLSGERPEYFGYRGRQVGMTIGPLFKHTFNEKFALFYGAGPGFLLTGEHYTQYSAYPYEEAFSKLTFSVGIGANIMLRYALGKRLTFLAGAILTYDFLGLFEVESSNPAFNDFGRYRDFSMFGVRPYLSLGLKL